MFVGFDASEMYLDTMRYRRIHGLVVQNSFLMGELGVRTLADHLNGKSVQKRIDITPVMVTPDNIDRPEIQRLLHLPPAAWFIQRDGTDRAFKNAKTRHALQVPFYQLFYEGKTAPLCLRLSSGRRRTTTCAAHQAAGCSCSLQLRQWRAHGTASRRTLGIGC